MSRPKEEKNPSQPTREDFIDRARDLVPLLRAGAHEAERNRGISTETHRAMQDAGLYRILQPRRYGGHEMDFGLLVDIAAELGRGCGSSAWVFTNLAVHGLTTGMKDVRAQDEIWGDDPEILVASAAPTRDVRHRIVDGGVVVNGTYSYSSGIDFADWVNLQIYFVPDDGPPEHWFVTVPRSSCAVVDDWFATGLAGTGSRSVVVNELFIPDYHVFSSLDVQGGPSRGSAVNPGKLYQLPFWGISSRNFAGPAVGIARGALELMEQDIATRTSVGGAKLAEQPTVQLTLAEAGAEIEAAWALLLRDIDHAMQATETGRRAPLIDRATWRRNNSFAIQLCVRAVERIFGLAGMRGMVPGNDIQRAWRDVHAAAAQVAIAWDPQAVNYGRARFGLPFNDPRA